MTYDYDTITAQINSKIVENGSYQITSDSLLSLVVSMVLYLDSQEGRLKISEETDE